MQSWLIYAGLSWVLFWLGGYTVHKRLPPAPSDVRLPLVIRAFFGNPRTNGTLNPKGIHVQVFGLLLTAACVLAAFGLVNRTGIALILLCGWTPLTIWYIWTLKRKTQ